MANETEQLALNHAVLANTPVVWLGNTRMSRDGN